MPKIPKCKQCGEEFIRSNSLQKTCSYKCLEKLNETKAKEKRKTEKMKKAVSVSALSKKADTLWSLAVKNKFGNACAHCGKTEYLNSHHIFGRNNKSVRWEIGNGICLCSGCHTFSSEFSAHKTPTEFTYWLEARNWRVWMDSLRELAHMPLKVTSEFLQEKIKFFQNLLTQ